MSNRLKRRKRPRASKKARERTQPAVLPVLVKKSRILFVEDEEPIREIVASMLKTAGFEVRTAADGAEALKVLNSGQTFDLLLCNLMMPRLDGLGVLEWTKAKFPDMPFVLHTAVHDISVALDALRKGAYDYLRVPFEREQLLAVVNRALEYRRLKIENRTLRAELEKLGEHPV